MRVHKKKRKKNVGMRKSLVYFDGFLALFLLPGNLSYPISKNVNISRVYKIVCRSSDEFAEKGYKCTIQTVFKIHPT